MASTKFLSNLVIDGSGGTVLDVQGSVGQLFSVTDSLTGDLFAVSDISGIPILNVNSSGAVDIDGTLNLGDSDKIQLGASQDLQIYHDGSHSYIRDQGSGNLIITGSQLTFSNVADTEYMVKMVQDGMVELYYNGSKKLETTSTGVTVTGNIGATNFSGSSSGTNTGDQDLSGYSTASGVEDNADVTDTANVVAALTAGTNVSIAANGTISATDTNYYLNAIERTDSTNTLVFGVSGATNQSFTFGANAFNSTTIPAAEQYTAHEDTSTLSGTYGSTANGTKIDQITVDSNGHITNISTGATGNMTGFFVEDGDGTEVQINNANEWKFVEGTGININWTDTDQGIDSDPYDLTFSLKDNSVSATQLNVSGNGTSGQVLTSDGDGTFSWSAKTANTDTITSVGISGSETSGTVTLTGAGATSITQSGGAIEIRSTDTQYTLPVAGSSIGGVKSGTDISVDSSGNVSVNNDSHTHDGRYYTESESDSRFPRGITKSYSSVDTASSTDAWYKIFQCTDSGSTPVECHLRAYAHTSISFIVSEGYQGSGAHINILDSLASSINSNYKYVEGVRVLNNGDVEVLLNGGSTVSLEMTLIGDASAVSVPELSSAVAADIKDSVSTLSNGMMRAKGILYLASANTNTTSTSALVLNGTAVEKRTLGSNAFNSTTYSTASGVEDNADVTDATNVAAAGALMKAGGTMTGNLTVSSGTNGDSKIIIESDTDNSNENDNPQLHFKQDGGLVNAYAGLVGDEGNIFTDSATNAAYFGVTNDVPLQLFTNSTSRLTINGNGTINLEAYGAGILKTDANGLISLDTNTYSTATGVENNADVTDTANVVAALTAGTNIQIAANGTISATDTNTTYSTADFDEAGSADTVQSNLDSVAANVAGISNQSNTDVDTGTETIAQVSKGTYTAAFFDFVIKNGTNVRAGTVYSCHDGTNVEFTETSTVDLGDTSDVSLSVDISGTNMRLRATTTSNNWSVKSLVRAI